MSDGTVSGDHVYSQAGPFAITVELVDTAQYDVSTNQYATWAYAVGTALIFDAQDDVSGQTVTSQDVTGNGVISTNAASSPPLVDETDVQTSTGFSVIDNLNAQGDGTFEFDYTTKGPAGNVSFDEQGTLSVAVQVTATQGWTADGMPTVSVVSNGRQLRHAGRIRPRAELLRSGFVIPSRENRFRFANRHRHPRIQLRRRGQQPHPGEHTEEDGSERPLASSSRTTPIPTISSRVTSTSICSSSAMPA